MKKLVLPLMAFVIFQVSFVNIVSAFDVIVRETSGSSNGSFVGSTWVPTGSPSILDYSELLTMLTLGNVVISTNGTGDINFEGADFTTSTGYDLASDRTLTLDAAGDIIIENSGIHPTLPANAGKLNVIVNSSANGDLIVRGAGLRTNGGDLTITGVEHVYQYNSGIFTTSGTGAGNLTFSGKVFTLGISENGGSQYGDMAVGAMEINVDTAMFFGFDLLQYGASDLQAKVASFKYGTVRYGGTTGVAGDTLGIKADSLYADGFHFDWKEDITVDAKEMQMRNFRIGDTTINHQTDIFIKSDYAEFTYGNFNLRNGMGTRTMDFDIADLAKFDGIRAVVSRGDGLVKVHGQDSLLFSCSSTGNVLGVQEGNGDVSIQSNYLYMYYTDASIRLGHGTVKIDAVDQLDYLYSVAIIVGDEGLQSRLDTVSLNARVLHFGYGNASIKRASLLDNYVHISATDSLNAKDHFFEKNNYRAYGGSIGFGNDINEPSSIYYYDGQNSHNIYISLEPEESVANGNIFIESNWIGTDDLKIGQHDGTGSIDVVGDVLKMESSGFQTGNGGINLELQDTVFMKYVHVEVDGVAADEDNDIQIKGDDICIMGSTVKNSLGTGNLTDITFEGGNVTLSQVSCNIERGLGSRSFNFLVDHNLKLSGTNVNILYGDGKINFLAGDSILLGYPVKGNTYSSGTTIQVNGSGKIKMASNDLFVHGTSVSVNECEYGTLDFDAAEKMFVSYGSLEVNHRNETQTAPDTLSMNAPIIHYGGTAAQISGGIEMDDNLLEVIALDSFNATNHSFPPNNYSYGGGSLGLVSNSIGNVMVHTGWLAGYGLFVRWGR